MQTLDLATNFDNMCRAITGPDYMTEPLTGTITDRLNQILDRLDDELEEDNGVQTFKRVIDDARDAVKTNDLGYLELCFSMLWAENWRFRYRSTLSTFENLIIEFTNNQ